MGMLERVRPVSWFKAHAAEVLRNVAEDRTPYVITQNGEAKAVLIDIASYEEAQETLALLKLAAIGREDAREGHVRPAREAVAALCAHTRERHAAGSTSLLSSRSTT